MFLSQTAPESLVAPELDEWDWCKNTEPNEVPNHTLPTWEVVCQGEGRA